MNFRKAALEDVPSIVSMLANDHLGETREQFSETISPNYWQAFKDINQDPNQELMVLEVENIIVGTFQLTFIPYLTYQGGLRAQIEAVRVHKKHLNKGLGQEMIKWAIKRARSKGAHLIQLTTDKKRPDAIRFYEKLGFKSSHEGMKMHFEKE